ncbi:TerC family protein [Ectobacillus funiculus]
MSAGALIALLKIIAIDIIFIWGQCGRDCNGNEKSAEGAARQSYFFGELREQFLLRIGFAAIIVYLLKVPYVNLVGGLLLLWIAYKVLVEGEEEANIKSHNGLMKSIQTIIVADAVMSLDNVVAVAGAAHGHLGMIALGVIISIPIMIFLVRKQLSKQWNATRGLLMPAQGFLTWTAGEMILKDKSLNELVEIPHGVVSYLILAVITALILGIGYLKNQKEP